MKFILATIGTAGDVNPFAAVGRALRARGHHVTLVTGASFADVAAREGFDFVELFSREEYESILQDPYLRRPFRSVKLFMEKSILPCMRRLYDIIAERADSDTIVVAPNHALGARVAQEHLDVPLATLAIAPFAFRTTDQRRPVLGIELPRWAPGFVHSFLFEAENVAGDQIYGRSVNKFRAKFGLEPKRQIFWNWWNSPELVIGMFPDWFAAPHQGWPANTQLFGFPLYDSFEELPQSLVDYLDDGEPPIVVTFGSGMAQAKDIFAAAAKACQRIGHRALFITKYSDQVPEELPETIRHIPYASFPALFPRVACVVHHGGIGTSSQALAAGVPQLIVPFCTDQPDNAMRLERLGTGVSILPGKFTPQRAAETLQKLLSEPQIKKRCLEVAQKCQGGTGLDQVCQALEKLHRAQPEQAATNKLQSVIA